MVHRRNLILADVDETYMQPMTFPRIPTLPSLAEALLQSVSENVADYVCHFRAAGLRLVAGLPAAGEGRCC